MAKSWGFESPLPHQYFTVVFGDSKLVLFREKYGGNFSDSRR